MTYRMIKIPLFGYKHENLNILLIKSSLVSYSENKFVRLCVLTKKS